MFDSLFAGGRQFASINNGGRMKQNKKKNKKPFVQKKVNSAIRIKDWFYMNDKRITVTDIDECMQDADNVNIEIWKDAGIAELALEDGHSIDMEMGEAQFSDEYSDAYLKEHGIQTLFYVTIAPDFYANAEPVMKELVRRLGGFFCADTDDFKPVVK